MTAKEMEASGGVMSIACTDPKPCACKTVRIFPSRAPVSSIPCTSKTGYKAFPRQIGIYVTKATMCFSYFQHAQILLHGLDRGATGVRSDGIPNALPGIIFQKIDLSNPLLEEKDIEDAICGSKVDRSATRA